MCQDLRSVLYVDDDPDICTVVEATLSTIGELDVRSASSGEIAIDLACEQRPDLILMDVMMPGLDGPSTLRRMRCCAAIADVPVIFLTAKVMPTEISQLLTHGAIGVLGKPFDPTRLCGDMIALWERTGRTGAPSRAPIARSIETVEISSLTSGFLARTARDVARLRQLLKRLQAGDRSALREIERVAHTIHGSAAMFGFLAVSERGGAIEDLAEAMMSPTSERFDAQLQRVSDHTDRLAEEVEVAAAVIALTSSAELQEQATSLN
jgi:two-component system, OmpR family, response regulator